MITEYVCRVKSVRLAGAALGLLAAVACAAPAEARGLVADMGTPVDISASNACALGSTCSTPVSFNGTNFYIYTDGVVSLGSQLPTNLTPSNLSTFGNSYFAVGLADYAALGYTMSVQDIILPDASFPGANPKLEIYWIFTGASPLGTSQALFGIQLTPVSTGVFDATAGFGLGNFTWFHSPDYNPYCDAVCVANPGSNVDYGVFLPNGALVGTSYSGTVFQTDADGNTIDLGSPYDGSSSTVNNSGDHPYSYPTYDFTNISAQASTSVPEPSTWVMMAFGLLSLGMTARRARKSIRGRA